MRIEAITVCNHYSDFLAETVKHNSQHFDRWVIVTTPDDQETLELCRRRNLTAVTTRELERTNDRGKFNKGRAISLGLNHVVGNGWLLHLDADVALPNLFRQKLQLADLDEECLYGCDRVDVIGWETWQRFQREGWLLNQHGYHLCNIFPPGYPVGTRVIRGRYGYTPIGFFQLFHGGHGVHSGMRWKDYPDTDSDAAHSDIKFALHWDRRHRVLLPEFWVAHLQSAHSAMGANWKGRTTPKFGPPEVASPSTPGQGQPGQKPNGCGYSG